MDMEYRLFHPDKLTKELSLKMAENIKIVFINMPLRESATPNSAPLGPAILASQLRNHGVGNVTIIDLNAYRVKDDLARQKGLENGRHLTVSEARELIKKHFDKFGYPEIVALSGLITTLRWQERTAKVVRELNPGTFIVSGGGLATEIGPALFKWVPELDAIAIGEGDEIILKIICDVGVIRKSGFVSALRSGKLEPYYFADMDNRQRFVYHGFRPLDLDLVPLPAWDLLEKDVNGNEVLESIIAVPIWGTADQTKNSSAAPFTMKRSLHTVSSRGCPFNCKFCYKKMLGDQYGFYSANRVFAEIDWVIKKYALDFVGFADDNFMVNFERIRALVPLLGSLNIRWGTHGRMDQAADMNQKVRRVGLMAEAGCVYIGFGAESAHHQILKSMGKGGFILQNGQVKINGFSFPKTMVEAVKITKAYGVHGNCTWIMGWPEETLDQLKTSVAFIKWQEEFYTQGLIPGTPEHEAAINSVNKSMFVATAYPGTPMFKLPIVRRELGRNFDISFDPITDEPVYDESFRQYVLELDDATKVLHSSNGKPVNFSSMSDDTFLEIRSLINSGQTYKILDI